VDFETLLTEQRWKIIIALSGEPLSPLQLSQRLSTSMANISQQLRLLEAASLVKKEKIPNRDKGKPRTAYSLGDNFAYLVSIQQNFAEKRLLKVDTHHRLMMQAWFVEDTSIHTALEQLIISLEPFMANVRGIFFSKPDSTLSVIDDNEDDRKKIDLLPSRQVKLAAFSKKEASRLLEQGKKPFSREGSRTFYDPDSMIRDKIVPAAN
jgi:DNA-binding HxlR family transcriptional regulator